jgi:guanine deaminase
MQENIQLFKGAIFYFTHNDPHSFRFIQDGALVVKGHKIVETGSFSALKIKYDVPVVDYKDKLIMPGFIDSHIHFPQLSIVGSYGKHLLDWLTNYTFPAEIAFSSAEYSKQMARQFIHHLLKNGTTSCMAYTTVYPNSTDALFEAASAISMNMMAGKVMMDQKAPDQLRDTPLIGEEQSRQLIEKWHRNGRNHYVITPRFAVTSSREQLQTVGKLHHDFPDTYIQTHLSESQQEISTVLELFPECKSYLEVYDKAGIVTDRTVFGHCIHLSDNEMKRIKACNSIIAHCPTSNLFLGSGLYPMESANELGIQTVLATDIGAGTSFSMFKTMDEAYKVQQLNNYSLNAFEAFYKCTKGAAVALKLEDEIGSFDSGCYADFIVVDPAATELQQLRKDDLLKSGKWNIENQLFGLMIQGDERNILHTYVSGQRCDI